VSRRAFRYGRGFRQPPQRTRAWWQRIADPTFYLKAVILLAGFGLIILPYGADAVNAVLKPVEGEAGTCRVLVVVDGDTVKLICPDSGAETARLIGFDAPEKFSPRCMGELVAAEKATWALRGMIFEADRLAVRREGQDRYGRALIRLSLDDKDVAGRMIKAGHGRAYSGGLRGGWC
jgi:micrococcal nuclease